MKIINYFCVFNGNWITGFGAIRPIAHINEIWNSFFSCLVLNWRDKKVHNNLSDALKIKQTYPLCTVHRAYVVPQVAKYVSSFFNDRKK